MKNYDIDLIDNIIIDYLSNQVDEHSIHILDEWRSMNDANEKYFQQQQEIWMTTIVAKPDSKLFDKDKAFERFKERTHIHETNTLKKTRNTPLFQYLKYAASIIILCTVAFVAYKSGKNVTPNLLADVIVESPLGSRTKLILPDGSTTWLNGGSKIIYPQGFGISNRTIQLEGEAYFEVKKNEKLPFTVASDDIEVAVLGTKFNFRDYNEDRESVVSLIEGKVALDILDVNSDNLTLMPDQRLVLDKKQKTFVIEKTNSGNATEWTNGYLFFDEEYLSDIAKKLERSYNVTITIASDSLKNFKFYGNFTRREQSIEEILDVLSSTDKMHYKIDGKNITLY